MRSVEAIRNGCTPSCKNRIGTMAAELACSVVMTRCPVLTTRKRASAVSKSRISPIIKMSGASRTIPRTQFRKVFRPKSLISTWLTCGMTTSMGDSAVWILCCKRIKLVQDAVNGGRFAATGRSRENNQSGSAMKDLVNLFHISFRHPKRNQRPDRVRISLHPQDDLFTGHMVGSVDAKEVGLVIVANLELAILRDIDPFSAQTRFVFQDRNDKIGRFRLQSQRLNPIAVGFVVNKQSVLVLRTKLDIGDVEIDAAR